MLTNSSVNNKENITEINAFNTTSQFNNKNVDRCFGVAYKNNVPMPQTQRDFYKDAASKNHNLTVLNNNDYLCYKKTSENMLQEKIKNLKKEQEELNNKLKNYEEMAQAFQNQTDLCSSVPNHTKKKSDFNMDLEYQDKENIPLNHQFPKKTNMDIELDKNFTTTDNHLIIIKDNKDNNTDFNDNFDKHKPAQPNAKPIIPFDNKHDAPKLEEKTDFSKDAKTDLIKDPKQDNVKDANKDNKNKAHQNHSTMTIGDLMNQEKEGISEELINKAYQPPKKSKSTPQDVEEYADDIYKELKDTEAKYLVDPNYMSYQEDINERMRAILIDWLTEVHMKYRLKPETMYICVVLIDRYLELKPTKRTRLQLVGVTAMFIACKYEEIYPPELKDFVYITDKAYVKQDVLDMEIDMLKTLNYSITFPTIWRFLETFKRRLGLDRKTFNMGYFLSDLMLINYKILKFKMSEIAAAAVLIATRIYRKYNANAFYYSTGYKESDLIKCADEISNFIYVNSKQNLPAIRRKFSSLKYDEVSKYNFF